MTAKQDENWHDMSFMDRIKQLGVWLGGPRQQPALGTSRRYRQLMIEHQPEARRHKLSEPAGRPSDMPEAVIVAEEQPVATLGNTPPAYPAMLDRMGQARIYRAFNAALPVADRYGLSGRSAEIGTLADGVLKQRKHGIIFGARGSGKTSLVRVFGDLADEAGCTVVYSSISGDLPFADIFRAYLDDLPGADGNGSVARRVAALRDTDFDVRALAGLLVGIQTQTVLVLDEFDRIDRQSAKDEVASLMKLLSDMRASVQVLLVGIAGDVDDLLAGHPSLRRHMVAMPIGPIARPSLTTLIGTCAVDAGMTIEQDALDELVSAAIGSPYHARLFGLEAALAANARGDTIIRAVDVAAGFGAALESWVGMSQATYDTVHAVLAHSPQAKALMGCLAVVAAYKSTFTPAGVRRMCDEAANWADGGRHETDALIALLAPILRITSVEGTYMFHDTLAPQFVRLMIAQGVSAARGCGETDMPDDVRLLFQRSRRP